MGPVTFDPSLAAHRHLEIIEKWENDQTIRGKLFEIDFWSREQKAGKKTGPLAVDFQPAGPFTPARSASRRMLKNSGSVVVSMLPRTVFPSG